MRSFAFATLLVATLSCAANQDLSPDADAVRQSERPRDELLTELLGDNPPRVIQIPGPDLETPRPSPYSINAEQVADGVQVVVSGLEPGDRLTAVAFTLDYDAESDIGAWKPGFETPHDAMAIYSDGWPRNGSSVSVAIGAGRIADGRGRVVIGRFAAGAEAGPTVSFSERDETGRLVTQAIVNGVPYLLKSE